MAEAKEIWSAPITPRTTSVVGTPVVASPPVSCPPSQLHSPSLTRSPLLQSENGDAPHPKSKTPKTPRTPLRISNLTPRFITPLGSPVRKALRFTKLDPQDAWLPITESRNGNQYYAAFHTLCSGIGIQALVLPVALTVLGWTWGIISLTLAFIWQLYTLWLLVNLHESVEHGVRYCRYLQLCGATFGEKVGKLLALFPILYLSAGTCTTLIIIGGSTARTFYEVVCGDSCTAKPMTTVEWYLVFTCAAVVLSQLPNLNSIAGISLIGAVTAVGYCTSIWITSVAEGALDGVNYDPIRGENSVENAFGVLNALGIIAFAFRGHNLILEIQSTMPSSEKHPSHVPMWKGVKVSYTLIAACLFPLTIGGYWAYGQLIPSNGGMLTALYQFHSHDVSRFVLGLTSFFVVVNALCSFQIYGMPAFDDMESQYTTRMKKPCPWWLRALIRLFFGFMCFFIGVAVPFLSQLAGLIGGVALPVTFAYPCFMWLKTKKPKKYSAMWGLNWFLGTLGVCLSVVLIAASLYVIIDTGVNVSFFNPHVHPSLGISEGPRSANSETINQLAIAIQELRKVKLQRMQRLQDLASTMLELWNLMDTPIEEQQMFQNVTCNIAASEHEVTEPNSLSENFINYVEAEVSRLEELKSSKMKELVLKKRAELEEICQKTHLIPKLDSAVEYAVEAIESGCVDPACVLEQLELQIASAKEEAFVRKEIIEKVEKWLAALDEESWLEEYNMDENRYNAGRGSHLTLKRAEKARGLVCKLPAMVEALTSKTASWEKDKGIEFTYDGTCLLSMLENYSLSRQEKEQERRKQRELKKLQGQIIVEKEVLYGSKPSPSKAQSAKKTPRISTGSPASRRISFGCQTSKSELKYSQSFSKRKTDKAHRLNNLDDDASCLSSARRGLDIAGFPMKKFSTGALKCS